MLNQPITALLALALIQPALAGEIRPAIGEPLRDAAVVRAEDGTYYLTGTRCMARRWALKQEGKQADYYLTESKPMLDPEGKPDFYNNDGAKVWSSTDLVHWKDEGLVWDLMAFNPGGTQWRGRSYAFPDRQVKDPRVRGLTSPKFFFKDGHWFTVESYGGREIGLLRSKGAAIGGPYEPYYKQPARRGAGWLYVHSAKEGQKTAETALPAQPVFDGMAAANGRLFLALSDGKVVCLGKERQE